MKSVTLLFCILLFAAIAVPAVFAANGSITTASTTDEPTIIHGVTLEPTAAPTTQVVTKAKTAEPTVTHTATRETTIATTETTKVPVAQVGWATIISTPSGASVSIDGKHAGVTPITGAELSAGTAHSITITMNGYKPYETSLTVSPAEQASVDATLSPEPTTEPTKTMTTVATTVSPTKKPTTAATTTVPTSTQTQIGGGAGWYRIHANVDGATASFDSLSSGCTIEDGSCTIEYYTTSTPFKTYTVQKPGYTTYTGSITAWPKAGQTIDLYATLNPTRSYGSVRVNSDPQGAVASLDGLTWQYTPCTFEQVTAGTNHVLQVSLSGYQTYTTTVYVAESQNTPVSVNLVKNPAQSGSISVATTPKGADIYVDGQYRGYSPTRISGLSPGSHSLRMQKAGYDEYMGTVSVYSGQVTPVAWTFSPLPATVGSIEVTSNPAGASVFLDGNYMGQTPSGDYLDLTSLATGSHTLTLQLAGYNDYTQAIQVTGGGVSTVTAEMSSSGQTLATTGQISVSSEPAGAEMYLDNTFRGITPLTLSGIAPGSHTVLLTMSGYTDSSITVNIAAGQLTPVAMSLAETSATPTKKSPLTLVPVLSALIGIGLVAAMRRK
ncbi:MAG: PEGA domain-containing protein [Methanoregulaceae archaeon]